jgi:fructose 1,6-bisphosphate aldolase/phosphatase
MNGEKWPAGFQIANGKLIGPRDLFDDPAFDRARSSIKEIASLRAYLLFS